MWLWCGFGVYPDAGVMVCTPPTPAVVEKSVRMLGRERRREEAGGSTVPPMSMSPSWSPSMRESRPSISSSCGPSDMLPSSPTPIDERRPAQPPSARACRARASPRANLRPHLWHMWGRSPVWSLEWRLRSWRRRKRAWHVWQTKGFSCECVRRCDLRLWWRVKVWLQCGHVCFAREPPGVVAEGLKGVVGVVALKPGVVGVVAERASEMLPERCWAMLWYCAVSWLTVCGWRSDGSVVLPAGAAPASP